MFNLHQAKNFVAYSLISLFFTAYPALAQGEKIVELDDETMKFAEIALIVISGLLITVTLFLAIAGVKQISQKNSVSTMFPAAIASIGGATQILLGGMIIGQLTPILGIFLTVFSGLFVAILIVAIVNSSFVA